MRISEKQKMKAKTFFANKEIVTEDNTFINHVSYDNEGRISEVTKKKAEPCTDELYYMPEVIDNYKYSSIDESCDILEITNNRKSATFSTKITDKKETTWSDDELEVINREYLDIGDNGVIFMADNMIILDDERLEWLINVPEFYKRYTSSGEFYLSRELIIGEDDYEKSISCHLVNGSLSSNELLLHYSDKSQYYDDVENLIYIDTIDRIVVCFDCNSINFQQKSDYNQKVLNIIQPENITIAYGTKFMHKGCEYVINEIELCDKIRNFACQTYNTQED